MTAPRTPSVKVILRDVGTEDVPDDACGFSEHKGDPICGKPAAVRSVAHGTWEGDSELTACADHAEALRAVIGWTEPIK